MHAYTGQFAALLTAFLWMLSALCWTAAGERVGSLAVNVVRLMVALPLLVLLALLTGGPAMPWSASPETWLWLGLSGVCGFFLCDLFLFKAFLLIGPRLGMLFLSLAPPLTALIGWLMLDEHLSPTNWLGMALTLGGVLWVVAESPAAPGDSGRRYVFTWRGGLAALAAAAAQAVAMVLAKRGLLPGDVSDVGATEIRLIAGLVCFLALVLALRRHGRVAAAFAQPRTMRIILLGALVGPVLGVTTMMMAVRRIPAGLAQTFLALSPVLIIPFMRLIYRERVGANAVAGALLACLGVALLFVGK